MQTPKSPQHGAARADPEVVLPPSETHFHDILEGVSFIAVELDTSGRVVFCNGFLLALTGYSREDVIGCDWFERFLPAGVRATVRRMFFDAIGQGLLPPHFENSIVTREGEERLIRWSNVMLRDPKGVPTGSASLGEDVTDRVRAEAALRESEDRYRRLYDGTPAMLHSIDAAGRLISVSDRWLATLGYARADVLGRASTEFLTQESRDHARTVVLPRFLSEGHCDDVAYDFVHRDGHVVPTLLSATAERDDSGRIVRSLAVITDISDRRRAEEEQGRLRAELAQSQKLESVGRLAGGIAHDFNNMLGAILGYADLALQEVSAGHPAQADLEEIRKAAERAAELTRQLLAFARRQPVVPRVLDLSDTVTGMLKMMRRLIGEDIELVWNPCDVPCRVRFDPLQLDQILANLCLNARDAIDGAGTITITTRLVFLDAHAPPWIASGEYVQLQVRDDGTGMDADTLEHIFEPFFTTKAAGAGTGLGLATVYGIVRQNDGIIEADSSPGHGTTFTISLPRAVGAVTAVRPRTPADTGGGDETILLVEDEPALLEMCQSMLGRLGYTVLSARSPDEAIRLTRSHGGEIDLLLTDVVMPGMNGRELAQRLLATNPQVRVLFMSGYNSELVAHHGVLLEGVHFLQKPFSVNALATKVREALEAAPPPRPPAA